MLRGILEAIKYLHQRGIAHGDIKPENILLDSDFNPKLSDFGYCKTNIIAGDESKSGTLYYAAPELFIRGQFNTLKTDIWSIGILLYIVSEGSFPFINGNQKFTIMQITSGKLNFKPDISDILINVIKRCTQLNPENRPTIEELIEDEYFCNFNKIDEFLIQDNIDPFVYNDQFSYNFGFDMFDDCLALV